MSDAALRELERAAHAGGDADAWTRLAQAQARAGQGGARAAVQALLRDPAAPVRELLVAGATPGPRALAPLPDLSLAGALESAGWAELLDLGRGRALVVSERQLDAVDLFDGALLWRRPRRRPNDHAVVVVGPYVAVLVVEGPIRLRWHDAATGGELGSLALPDAYVVEDLDELLAVPLVALGGSRCAVLVPISGGHALNLCDLGRGEVTRSLTLPYEDHHEAPSGLLGAEGVACLGVGGRLLAWSADGTARWTIDLPGDGEAELLGVDADRLFMHVSGPAPAPDRVLAFDLTDGRDLPIRVDCSARSWDSCVAGGLVVTAERRQDRTAVTVAAWSLEDGQPRWQRAFATPGVAPSEIGAVQLQPAGDVLLVVDHRLSRAPGRRGAPPWATSALDLATGVTLWTRPDREAVLGLAGGLLLALGPTEGWLRKTTPLRRYGPA